MTSSATALSGLTATGLPFTSTEPGPVAPGQLGSLRALIEEWEPDQNPELDPLLERAVPRREVGRLFPRSHTREHELV